MQMQTSELSSLSVIRREGNVVPFDAAKIRTAIANAFLKDGAGRPRRHGGAALSASERAKVDRFTDEVVAAVTRRWDATIPVRIEDIQDQVELVLMRAGEHEVARGYVLFRQRRAELRETAQSEASGDDRTVVLVDGDERRRIGRDYIAELVVDSCRGIDGADADAIVLQALRNLPAEVTSERVVDEALLLAASSLIERDPAYDRVTAQLFLRMIRGEVLGEAVTDDVMAKVYAYQLAEMVSVGIDAERLDQRLAEFDLKRLGEAIQPERDREFRYMGLQVLYDRYFMQVDERRIELPQSFFMRIAMGLALNEEDRNGRAIEFYDALSTFRFMNSTPTLFNAGTVMPQLSSCYLTTVADDLDGIYESIKDNAMLQKFAGGMGNDWTRVRALGSRIKGTNGKSQGTIPFLKVVNDTAVAVNQGGKRKGAVCAYLETWHLDIEEFVELRKNAGDDRRRTHDMNTAHWVPDLFMKRVISSGEWTLFSPVDVPDLHEKYGRAFEKAYVAYEAMAADGRIKHAKTVQAVALWRKMLSMLFETGHPWICFKDACNVRSPQQHVGVVHSSNLCTEITLNTSDEEIAVCNLGSVNLAAHMVDGTLDRKLLRHTVRTGMRMLDNVIDLNHYAVEKARRSNMRHRPVGLGLMGLQDALYALQVSFASDEAVHFGSAATEALCYYAYEASSDLAAERGRYESFGRSLWNFGILPPDTVEMLRTERGGNVEQDGESTLDWDALRKRVCLQGMRNSNCVAIAPTATIASIVGVNATIEPAYQNLYVKSNLSGEFTVVNESLVRDLKALGLWDEVMVADLKYFDGSVQAIDRVPAELKALYATAFEIDARWLIEAASARQRWIDQSQSVNLFFRAPSGATLDAAYKLAWTKGLKTTYYLRALAATSAEKSTGRVGALNAVSVGTPAASTQEAFATTARPMALCALDNPECESCQ
jgi:ribonucleoside-diphosphate reductase alpha chain